MISAAGLWPSVLWAKDLKAVQASSGQSSLLYIASWKTNEEVTQILNFYFKAQYWKEKDFLVFFPVIIFQYFQLLFNISESSRRKIWLGTCLRDKESWNQQFWDLSPKTPPWLPLPSDFQIPWAVAMGTHSIHSEARGACGWRCLMTLNLNCSASILSTLAQLNPCLRESGWLWKIPQWSKKMGYIRTK